MLALRAVQHIARQAGKKRRRGFVFQGWERAFAVQRVEQTDYWLVLRGQLDRFIPIERGFVPIAPLELRISGRTGFSAVWVCPGREVERKRNNAGSSYHSGSPQGGDGE